MNVYDQNKGSVPFSHRGVTQPRMSPEVEAYLKSGGTIRKCDKSAKTLNETQMEYLLRGDRQGLARYEADREYHRTQAERVRQARYGK